MGKKLITSSSSLAGFFKGKKVLITGHTGFKGSWLAEILCQWGADVVGLALPPHTQPSMYEVLQLDQKVKTYTVDIRDFEKVLDVFHKEKPEIVFHLAAQAIVKLSYDDPLKTYSTNVLGTANVLQAIRQTSSIKSAVIITSDKAYKNVEWVYPYRETDVLGGHDPYSASKSSADIVVQSFIYSFFSEQKPPFIAITRAGNVIGGGDWSPNRIIPDIIRAVYSQKKPVIIRSPNAIRPWQFVLEPLSGYLMLAQKLYEGESRFMSEWNFGPSDENFVPVLSLMENGVKILGKGTFKIVPDKELKEATLLKLDISKAKSLLGWHPALNFSQTMEFTFSWYKCFYEQPKKISQFTRQQIVNFFELMK
jgi:CDP-glucose 4,6-dehydratase